MEPKSLLFLFFSTGLGGLILSGLLIYSQKLFPKNFFLSLFMFCLCLSSIYNFLYLQGLLGNFPFFFIINQSCLYLIAPSAYLYIRNIFGSGRVFKRHDWIHFLPFFLVVAILSNLALQNPFVIKDAINNNSTRGFLVISQSNVYHALSIGKYLSWFVYIIMQSLCIINFERRKKPASYQYNSQLINWIKGFNIAIIILFLILLIQKGFEASFVSIDFVNDLAMSVTLLVIIGFLITKLHVLYNLKYSDVNTINDDHIDVTTDFNPHVTSALVKSMYNVKKKVEYLDKLQLVIERDKPYLNKGITVKDLADQTGIPAHHLSYLINVEFNLHFQDFINLKRIEYLKSKIGDMEFKNLTQEGICWEFGFNSRTTFFRAFIKLTGVSPSEYFRNLKKNNSA